MARTETWFDQDLKKPVSVRIMAGVQFSEDNQGSLIGVRVYDDGAEATLTGGATGYCILADGQTITVDGTREGNTAYILLPQSALLVPGPIQITIKLVDDGVITTLLACVGTVIRTKIGVPVVPGSVIEEWSEQISETLQECVDDCQAAADAMGANLAAAYSSSATYPVGSYVIQSGTLYRCTTAVTTAGSWSTNSSKFTAVKLGNDVADLKSATDELTNTLNGVNGLRDQFEVVALIIKDDGTWVTPASRHLCVPVTPNDTIEITANSQNDGVYAALKSNSAVRYETADFCDNTQSETWEERKIITRNTTVAFTAPSDCNYIYLAVHGSNSATNQVPTRFLINGIDIAYNIRAKIGELESSIADFDDELSALSDDISGLSDDISGLSDDVSLMNGNISLKAGKRNLDIWGMRGEYGRMFSQVDFSGISFLSGFNFNVYSDGYKFIHSVDLSAYKNVSVNTITVSTNNELATAISGAASGDTIIVNDGVYEPVILTKSINLIGNGKPVFVTDDAGEFTTTGSSVVFRTTNSFTDAITDVYDASRMDEGIIMPMTKKTSSSGVINTPGSWALLNSGTGLCIYVHLFDGRVATNRNVILCDKTKIPIQCTEPTENATVYIENIVVVGGQSNILFSDYGSYNTQKLIAKGCRFYYGRTYNNVSMYGVDGFFQNCESSFSHKDGFNYHKNTTSEYPGGGGPNTGTIANGFEIDCIAHDNGYDDTSTNYSDNGSTMHNGGTAVRINGIYYHNKGGNVADTHTGTISYNYGCYAFDNMAPEDTNRADFWSYSNATMYLYGCRSDGDSQYNLWAQSGATIYADKVEYTTKLGNIIDV